MNIPCNNNFSIGINIFYPETLTMEFDLQLIFENKAEDYS